MFIKLILLDKLNESLIVCIIILIILIRTLKFKVASIFYALLLISGNLT